MEIDHDNDPIRRPTDRQAGHFLGYVSRSQAALNKLCANWNWIESGQLYRAIAVPRVTTHDRLSGESWTGKLCTANSFFGTVRYTPASAPFGYEGRIGIVS